MPKLEGKVAFLTGAGAGIAKAAARLYAAEGAKVAIRTGGRAHRALDEALGDEGHDARRASIALFLACDDSRMVTGTTIAADGGRSSYLRVIEPS